MLRRIVVGAGVLLALLVAWQVIHVTDLERVEDEMERLFEAARRGGDDAAAEILDAFADDYRGAGLFRMESVERNVRSALVPAGTTTGLSHGDFQPVQRGEEIVVPIVAVSGAVKGRTVSLHVAVTWAKRAGAWKIVDVTRMRFGG